MGIYLEIQNQRSRQISYVKYSGNSGSRWASRNMIISGLVVLAFLIMHFYDFWFPEMVYKYIEFKPLDEERYFYELQHKFQGELIRVILYCSSFILLGLHLAHGFASSLQSMGITKGPIKIVTSVFSLIVPAGFVFIALFHYIFH
jgi:succinate dehydrogenase / fumarate reductase cytochrome b subunit